MATPSFLSVTDLVGAALRKLGFPLTFSVAGLRFEFQKDQPLDERLKAIDAARENLEEALRAVGEVRNTALRHKQEAADALAQLTALANDKVNVEHELELVRELAKKDVGAFRKIAGFPSRDDIRRERILGFITGVIASIVAAAICGLFGWIWAAIASLPPPPK